MQAEFAALQANYTWVLCPQPPDKNVIRCKWVFKVKQASTSALDKLKARFLARGFKQNDGLDFIETFSPIAKPTIVRVVFLLAIHFH